MENNKCKLVDRLISEKKCLGKKFNSYISFEFDQLIVYSDNPIKSKTYNCK